ncbi:MAG: hypothetical protein RRZ68_02425 [Oscillospiraceae bacterium]
MKKLFCIFTVIIIVISFCSCGILNKSEDETQPTDESSISDESVYEEITENDEFEVVTDENGKVVTNKNGEAVTRKRTSEKDDNEILNSGKFLLSGSMYINNYGYLPMKIGLSNERVGVRTSFSGIDVNIISANKKGYLVFPKKNVYCNIPASLANQLDVSAMAVNDKMKLTSTVNTKLDGTDVVCKTYKDNSSSIKYYMNGKKILKIEVFDKKGKKDTEVIVEYISKNPKSSFFTVGNNCKKVNFTELIKIFKK